MLNQLSYKQLQLRYLLHGNPENFNNKDWLYLLSESDELWQKVARELFAQNNESWRIIETILANQITPDKRQSLNITILSRDSVIEEIKKDINKNGISSLDVELLELTLKEREDILSEIRKNPQNKDYWLKLPLHETLDSQFISISGDRIYLENLAFLVPPQLNSFISIIKRSGTLDQKWIEEWTPKIAIDFILKTDIPSQYFSIILDCLSKLNNHEKNELVQTLKTKQWLINAQNQSAISPNNLLYISDNHLQNHTDKIVSLNQSLNQDKYSDSVLPEFIREHSEYKWLTSNLFDNWDAKKIVKFVLNQPNPDHFWEIILDVVQSLNYNLDSDIEKLLQDRKWITVNNGTPKKPNQIIDLAPIKPLEPLKKYLPTLVELSEDAYALFSMLPPEMQEHGAFNWLKGNKYFSIWYQNNIIDFILHLQQPHQNCQILLATVDNLLKNNHNHNQPISSNNSQSLKQKAWLITSAGKPVIPQQVIYYPDLSEEINHILSITRNLKYTDYSKLDESIKDKESKEVVDWLSKNCFITEEDAFKKIGELVANIPEYQLGKFDDFLLQECLGTKNELGVFQGIPSDILPCWSLVEKVAQDRKSSFERYILPALLNEIEETRLISLLKWLFETYHKPTENVIKVYNYYLSIACNFADFHSVILPQIQLLNEYKRWHLPFNLCYEGSNIDGNDILSTSHKDILINIGQSLKKNHNAQTEQSKNDQIKTSDDSNSTYQILKDYCEYLAKHINRPELIGCFLGLLTGNNNEIKQLAQAFLGRRNFIDVIKVILLVSDGEILPCENINFIIKNSGCKNKNNTVNVTSIMGTQFLAHLKGEVPEVLFNGQPDTLTPNTIVLNIVAYEEIENKDINLLEIVKQSCQWLINKVYNNPKINASRQININNFLKEWDKLSSSEQLDITFAERYIFNGINYYLDTLKLSNQHLVKKIKEYTRLIYHQIETKQNLETKSLKKEIKQLFKDQSDPHNVIQDTFNDIQKKIMLHGYSHESIPFEIFQNADDALVEWQQMLGSELSLKNKLFVISISNTVVNFMHWGRPINCFRHPNNPNVDYSARGFDFDLVNMLVFSNSEKSETEEEMTGQFGLGFKSVYLLSDKPLVLSHDLGFTVRGGLLPYYLDIEDRNNLRKLLEEQNPDLNYGTIISLPLNLQHQGKVDQILNLFRYLAGILLVFSHRIKQCKLINSFQPGQTKELSWQPQNVLDISEVEFGQLEILENQINSNKWVSKRSLCFNLDKKGSLLICFDEVSGKIQSSLPEDIPTLWVTAPTTEKLRLGFLLNAKFHITTGRQKFIESDKNHQLAKEIGELLGKQLCLLFNKSQGNWSQLKTSLHLQDVNEYDFWLFIWQELAEKWLHKDYKDSNYYYALNIIRLVLSGNCGMGYFITHCPSLPNGLWGNYQKLISPEKTRYIITGILAHQDCFNKVSTWTEFTKRCLNNIVNESVWNNVKLLLGSYFQSEQTKELKLIDVLKWELGESSPKASPTVAKSLGQLMTKEFLSALEIRYTEEYLEIKQFLKTVKFEAENNNYYPSQKLFVKYY